MCHDAPLQSLRSAIEIWMLEKLWWVFLMDLITSNSSLTDVHHEHVQKTKKNVPNIGVHVVEIVKVTKHVGT